MRRSHRSTPPPPVRLARPAPEPSDPWLLVGGMAGPEFHRLFRILRQAALPLAPHELPSDADHQAALRLYAALRDELTPILRHQRQADRRSMASLRARGCLIFAPRGSR